MTTPLARPRWEVTYVRAAVLSDLLAIVVAVLTDELLGFGLFSPQFGPIAVEIGVVVSVLMFLSLLVNKAWDPRILGTGSEEFSRLIRAFFTASVLLALTGLALQQSATRPWVFGTIPLAGVVAALGRLGLRKILHRQRAAGRCLDPVLVVGNWSYIDDMIARTRRDTSTGWRVSAVCTPTGAGPGGGAEIMGVPVVGDLDSVAEVVRQGRFRVVSVAPASGWTSARLRSLAWDLESSGVDLVVDPGLMEVAGPRLHIAPVDGLPLLRLTEPDFTGAPWVLKHTIDKLGAAILLVLTAPLFLAVAFLIMLDGGPVLFRQVRVGRYGQQFTMLKFRTMVVDAERRMAELLERNDSDGPLFKLRVDPRVTRIGAFLRRYSIDELPQLINVLTGSMTLVGPRPPLPGEVAKYSRDAERKLLVRPGLTGIWQVSGRSDLAWEESVRLDLRYVENWSLALDALILCKTVAAVLKGNGAY